MRELHEAERHMVATAMRTYRSRDERAAMRCALADAAGLLDAFAKQIANEQRYRGVIKKRGLEQRELLTKAANLVWDMREKITFDDATPRPITDRDVGG